MWLRSVIAEQPPPTFLRLYKYSMGLRTYGPPDKSERQLQNELLRAFILELRGSRLLRPPNAPARAMPLDVFRKVMMALSPKRLGAAKEFGRNRLRAGLKMARAIGLKTSELSKLRRGWLAPHPDGMLLNYQDGNHRDRTLAIPRHNDELLCAVVELEAWLSNAPDDPLAFVFPATDSLNNISWSDPTDTNIWSSSLRKVLLRLGERGYCWESIRRDFQKRSWDQLGPAATIYLAGYKVPTSLGHNLRREQNWSRIKSLLND